MTTNPRHRGWLWFALVMGVILIVGILLRQGHRRELGESFTYTLEAYRQVDPALRHYEETGAIEVDVGILIALAVGPEDSLWVAGERGVAVLDASGQPVRQFALETAPSCLAIDEEGVCFVGFKDHVEVFGPDGTDPARGPSLGEKAYLTSLALTDQGLYAADAGGRVVWQLDRAGKPVRSIQGRTDDPEVPGFVIPSPYFDLVLGPDDSLWVVNPAFHALENYRPDGTLISTWNKTSMHIDGFSGCCNPSHLALLPDGSFVTSEKGIPRVKIHGPAGDLRSVVAAPDQFDEEVTGLDLAVDSRGRIYVLDPIRGTVRIFVKKEAAP